MNYKYVNIFVGNGVYSIFSIQFNKTSEFRNIIRHVSKMESGLVLFEDEILAEITLSRLVRWCKVSFLHVN